MKYVRQLLIILFVSFFGELLKYIIPLSIPASIYGMVLLFLALELKILKVSDIKETSNFLDRKSTRLNSSHWNKSRMPSSA